MQQAEPGIEELGEPLCCLDGRHGHWREVHGCEHVRDRRSRLSHDQDWCLKSPHQIVRRAAPQPASQRSVPLAAQHHQLGPPPAGDLGDDNRRRPHLHLELMLASDLVERAPDALLRRAQYLSLQLRRESRHRLDPGHARERRDHRHGVNRDELGMGGARDRCGLFRGPQRLGAAVDPDDDELHGHGRPPYNAVGNVSGISPRSHNPVRSRGSTARVRS